MNSVGNIIMWKRNRIGPGAGPTLVLKGWLGLQEVEDWELKLDAEEELQVEEVDRLFREHAAQTWFCIFFVYYCEYFILHSNFLNLSLKTFKFYCWGCNIFY